MLRITNPMLLAFEGVVALCVACAIHSALAHNFADFLECFSSALLLGGTLAITRIYKPEIFERDER